jgi:hypothetical protein
MHRVGGPFVKSILRGDMKCAAVFILVSFAIASQASAVLRPLFPVKSAPPFSGEAIIIEDHLVRRLSKGRPVEQMSTLEKPGAEIRENAYSNWVNVDRVDH